MAITAGSQAPDFTLPASNGTDVSLADFRGQWVVLYFYPKDNTPGCTREACDFRDAMREFTDRKAVVLGDSPEGDDAHGRFIREFGLPFLLLADQEKEVAKAYGVWVEKTNYGKQSMGIERSTFVIGPAGDVKAVFRKVKVEGHVDEVLEAIGS
jgi:peroxiredoxin Q/BCP